MSAPPDIAKLTSSPGGAGNTPEIITASLTGANAWQHLIQEGSWNSPLLPRRSPFVCNGVLVHISKGFDPGLLTDILSVLKADQAIAPPGIHRVFLYDRCVDMRKSFEALSRLIESPYPGLLTGALFLFLNRRRNLIKIL